MPKRHEIALYGPLRGVQGSSGGGFDDEDVNGVAGFRAAFHSPFVISIFVNAAASTDHRTAIINPREICFKDRFQRLIYRN